MTEDEYLAGLREFAATTGQRECAMGMHQLFCADGSTCYVCKAVV